MKGFRLVFFGLFLILTGVARAQEMTPSYYVQLAASRTFLPTESIREKLQLKTAVMVIRQDEWYKYLLGPFASHDLAYADMRARDLDGFVTRYVSLDAYRIMDEAGDSHALPAEQAAEEVEPQKAVAPPVIGRKLEKVPGGIIRGFDAAAPHSLIRQMAFLYREGQRGTVVDPRDGTAYGWIRLGHQVWMTSNIRLQTGGAAIPAMDSLLPADYGLLYPYEVALGVCPAGWHLPDDAEWMELERFLGMDESEIRSIGDRRSGHTALWLKSDQGWAENGRGNDWFGFQALPAGWMNRKGQSLDLHHRSSFWTSSPTLTGIWIRSFTTHSHGTVRSISSPHKPRSVRCVKNISGK